MLKDEKIERIKSRVGKVVKRDYPTFDDDFPGGCYLVKDFFVSPLEVRITSFATGKSKDISFDAFLKWQDASKEDLEIDCKKHYEKMKSEFQEILNSAKSRYQSTLATMDDDLK